MPRSWFDFQIFIRVSNRIFCSSFKLFENQTVRLSTVHYIRQSQAKTLGLKYSDFLGRNDKWILLSLYSLELQGSQLPGIADLAIKTTNGFNIPWKDTLKYSLKDIRTSHPKHDCGIRKNLISPKTVSLQSAYHDSFQVIFDPNYARGRMTE
jgi:hypothetical protein